MTRASARATAPWHERCFSFDAMNERRRTDPVLVLDGRRLEELLDHLRGTRGSLPSLTRRDVRPLVKARARV